MTGTNASASTGAAQPGGEPAFGWREFLPPSPFHAPRFTSPAAAASRRGGRAVVVWAEPARPQAPGALFHLSVAERGKELYAFTVRGDQVERSGHVPATLAPDRFFGTSGQPGAAVGTSGQPGAAAALTALADEFGVSLSRSALTRGRLHTFTTRSWTRLPEPGETYTVIRIGPYRPGEDT